MITLKKSYRKKKSNKTNRARGCSSCKRKKTTNYSRKKKK